MGGRPPGGAHRSVAAVDPQYLRRRSRVGPTTFFRLRVSHLDGFIARSLCEAGRPTGGWEDRDGESGDGGVAAGADRGGPGPGHADGDGGVVGGGAATGAGPALRDGVGPADR